MSLKKEVKNKMGKKVCVVKEDLDSLISEYIKSDVDSVYEAFKAFERDVKKLRTVEAEIETKEEICNCYEIKERVKYLYDRYTGKPDSMYMHQYGVCVGTKDREEVECKGNRFSKKCVYYKEHMAKRAKENGKV